MVSTFAARRVLHVLAMVEAAGRQGNLPQAHAATVDLLGEISRLKSQLTELPPLSTEERLGVGKKEAV
jgi:hypothetical protein